MKFLFYLLLLFQVPDSTLIPVKIIGTHDGDTVKVNVLFGWDIVYIDKTLRFYQVDTYEINKTRSTVEITDKELALGATAKAELDKLLASAEAVYVRPAPETDPYGRLLGTLFVQQKGKKTLVNVSEYMEPWDRVAHPVK